MQRLLSSQQWLQHYRENLSRQLPIPWESGGQLTEAESRNVVRSLQAWQLGETSDGNHFLEAARRYAIRIDDSDFLAVVRMFIDEENHHGEMLGRFLDLHGAGRIGRNWGDSIFRRMRSALLSLEIWTTVVIVVETLALIYYRAIMQATASPVLQAICRQILKDEVHHLQFQYERLARMYVGRGPVGRWLTRCSHQVLFLGTTLAVWVGHRRALIAGGYPLPRFWQSTWKRMQFHWEQMGLANAIRVEQATARAVGTKISKLASHHVP